MKKAFKVAKVTTMMAGSIGSGVIVGSAIACIPGMAGGSLVKQVAIGSGSFGLGMGAGRIAMREIGECFDLVEAVVDESHKKKKSKKNCKVKRNER